MWPCKRVRLVDSRDEAPLDDLAVLNPVIAVLAGTLLKVAATTMGEDCEEEHRVEHGDGGVKSSGRAPGEGLDEVCSVIHLLRC